MAQVTRQATIADLQRDTALAWLERSYQESMRDLLKSQIAQAELQVEAAQTLYRSGKGSQAEVFAARGTVEQLARRYRAGRAPGGGGEHAARSLDR
jgi:outer membrane protein TolC